MKQKLISERLLFGVASLYPFTVNMLAGIGFHTQVSYVLVTLQAIPPSAGSAAVWVTIPGVPTAQFLFANRSVRCEVIAMKCRSVVGIWPDAPPLHRVVATVVLNQPPSLYTGATDGSIVWWSFSGDDSNQEIKPIAILCGHAAPIADLGFCYPLLASADGIVDHTSDIATNFSGSDSGALVSACRDSVLCVWSSRSGYCRRRRKLPPWVGSPSVVRTLPANPRYVCIACCFIDAFHATDNDYVDPTVGNEHPGDRELNRKPSKSAIVIVDSYTLTIIQTVFHGNLSIGPLKFMVVVRPIDDKKQFVLVGDQFGQLQLIPLLKDSNLDVEAVTELHNRFTHVKTTTCGNVSPEGGLVLSIATTKLILGLLYRTNCVVLLMDGTVIGCITFENSLLSSASDLTQSHPVGGIFLQSDDSDTLTSGETHGIIAARFVVWNDRGFAIVYAISYIDGIFRSEVVYEIPSVCNPTDVRMSISFVQLKHYILRVESICFHEEDPLLWNPHITIWSPHQQLDEQKNVGLRCKMIGEGDFLVYWIDSLSHTSNMGHSEHALGRAITARKTAVTALGCSFPSEESVNSWSIDDAKYIFSRKGHFVSCSMVISQSTPIPYAIVYGYHNGEIELLQFPMCLDEVDLDERDVHPSTKQYEARQHFSGHTGAVLCLAAHRMVGASTGQSFSHVLLSGSMDCTVRVWDLETKNPIMVMHHHVAPVQQLILSPVQNDRPWNNCFLSVGKDFCVALASLETLQVERMFPGHPNYPAKVVWDGERGYLACLCLNHSAASDTKDVLYIWDIKTGAQERVLRGTASHSMFDYFCTVTNNITGRRLNRNTSASSLLLPLIEDGEFLQYQQKKNQKGSISSDGEYLMEPISSQPNASRGNSIIADPGCAVFHDKMPINCSCPFSGVAVLNFDLASLMSFFIVGNDTAREQGMEISSPPKGTVTDGSNSRGKPAHAMKIHNEDKSLSVCLLRFCLSFLHLWDVDCELDNLLVRDMKLKKPEKFNLAPGLQGDRGSVTLAFPGFHSALELWKSSSEFCAMRSLTMVSLGQHIVSLSPSCSAASCALSAFYTRNFAEKFPHIKSPSLQFLVSFWQDEDDHVRMAARSLFHCAASRAIPPPLFCPKAINPEKNVTFLGQMRGNEAEYEEETTTHLDTERLPENELTSRNDDNDILKWMESYELQDWISCAGGTSQDAMTSRIIVAAALAIWYPSLVKYRLAMLAIHPLMKLVMAMNEKYSSSAAELLAEGMDSTWKACIGSEITSLIGDIFFQIECVSGANTSAVGPAVPPKIRETLIGVLLPSLALADISGFLTVIEGLIWSTSSDSPVHLISLKTLIRVMRGSPRSLAQYLNKVVNFILQTMDPSNLVMRRTCLQSSMTALKEVTRIYPMVALNEMSSRLAVGDAIAETNCAIIHVYDMQSVTKIRVLDASGPPGLPSLLAGTSETFTTAISALSFSPDGEGLVAFSEHGLIIRWWSLGSAWWEKLSRNYVPVQCTKLIFVPPWEGFSPNSSRASIMAKITGNDRQASPQEHLMNPNEVDRLLILTHNLDLSYRIEWIGGRRLVLSRQVHALGTFQL
ncbi:hypothetical protein Nepgr_024522 [Nepenthes gracilis]|uniref:Uncharacterized protein n=1 Tax=Nepenthes gracilis TaxID=150966 RepID=A0AAD3Y041_NEPGR|nr:hypothetical protein Nepgr_024522 [Nepenthes gracilis]